MLKVNDLLKSQKLINNFTISPYSSILAALMKMSEEKVGVLAVIDDDEIVGIIEENTFLKMFYQSSKLDINQSLFNVMEMKVLYVTKEYTLEECLALMSNEKIFHLPVLEDNKFIGMISLHEVSAKLIEDKEYIIANLSQYISGNLVFNTSTLLPLNVQGKVLSVDKAKVKFRQLRFDNSL